METCGNLNSSKAFLGFPRFSKYPVTNHITWIHGNPRDSSWIHVGYMEMYGNPHVSKLSMWNYVDRTAKKFRDESLHLELSPSLFMCQFELKIQVCVILLLH